MAEEEQTLPRKAMRANRMRGLYNNAGQTSRWQTQVLEEIDEIKRDNQLLTQAYAMLKKELDALKQERLAA